MLKAKKKLPSKTIISKTNGKTFSLIQTQTPKQSGLCTFVCYISIICSMLKQNFRLDFKVKKQTKHLIFLFQSTNVSCRWVGWIGIQNSKSEHKMYNKQTLILSQALSFQYSSLILRYLLVFIDSTINHDIASYAYFLFYFIHCFQALKTQKKKINSLIYFMKHSFIWWFGNPNTYFIEFCEWASIYTFTFWLVAWLIQANKLNSWKIL